MVRAQNLAKEHTKTEDKALADEIRQPKAQLARLFGSY
jgi:hypothetical protein